MDTVPPESATVVISPKPAIHDDGITGAEPHVHLVAPSTMSELALDVASAWDELLTKNTTAWTLPQLRQFVAETFNTRGVLPSQIHERLTRDPVASKGGQP